ncbi:hypothetical protein LSH36_148g05049, partial [Paralvinella palmiformis]
MQFQVLVQHTPSSIFIPGMEPRSRTRLELYEVQKKMSKSGTSFHCCVPHCTGDSRISPDLTFHRFPSLAKRSRLRDLWIQAIKRDLGLLFQITSCTRVCGRHFTPNDYKRGVMGPKRGKLLENDSVPSVFSWTVPKNTRINIKDKIRARFQCVQYIDSIFLSHAFNGKNHASYACIKVHKVDQKVLLELIASTVKSAPQQKGGDKNKMSAKRPRERIVLDLTSESEPG